jgi:hypothetical protein
VNKALDAAGIPRVNSVIGPLDTNLVPGSAGYRAWSDGATPYMIPYGTTTLPTAIAPFEPRPR